MKRVLAAIPLMILLVSAATAAPIKLQLGNSKYFGLYDPATRILECVSEHEGRQWRAGVASSVPSQADWAGRPTSAGPAFVYTNGSNVQFVLLRYLSGATTAEKSGESLRGDVAPGRLLNASWVEAKYGAKATVVSLAGSIEYTTVVDINMWGTGKVLSQTHRTIETKREKLPNTSLSFEVPPSFTTAWDASSNCMGIMSSNKLPMGMLVVSAEGGVNLTEFADEFMNTIGPAMGAADLKVALSDQVSVGALPGLLRLSKCTWNSKPATFAFVFCGNAQNTYVFVYAAPNANYDQYAGIFYRLLGSVQFQ